MRYAGFAIKAVSLILIGILFMLFLLYAAGFGEDGNMADLAMSNILVSAMILVLIVSALSALAFDFYEEYKHQTQEIFNALNEKIAKLEKIEPTINEIMQENYAKNTQLIADFSQKLEQNDAKTEEFMRQFANLSVQVFAKDKQAQNMKHSSNNAPKKPVKSSDYFNHYTKPEAPDDSDIEVLKKEDKIASADINEQKSGAVDKILSKNTEVEDAQNQLSQIFNDELADTLADLEIMKDEPEQPQSEDIDLDAYFTNAEKVKL